MRALAHPRPAVLLLLATIVGGCSILDPGAGPDASFRATPRSGTAPMEVQFTDESDPGSAPITERTWWFGDGTKSSDRDPRHVYQEAGTYDVALLVATKAGADTEYRTGFIRVSVKPAAPVAAFVGAPTSGTSPLSVQFTDQSSPGGAAITSWAWTFGDGGTSTSKNPSHAYEAAGTYTVALTVTTSAGSDTEEKTGYIQVSDPTLPTAAFTGSPRTGLRPLEVGFTDQSTPGTYPITSWSWSFGDGGTSTSQNPVHTYAAAGTYTVSLTVTTSAGSDTETQTGYVVVSDPVLPTAAFTGTPRTGFVSLEVQFTDQSTAGSFPITSWSWSFGDGGTSTSPSPSHTYTAAGTYTVALTVTTSAGSDTETQVGYVVVSEPVPPTAGFSGSPQSGPIPLDVQFTDQSTAGTHAITSWSWSFGDGGTSTSQNPRHVYGATGSFDVSLTVTTGAGSDDEAKGAYIVATQPPVAAFDGSPRTGDRPLAVQFTDQSTVGSAPITAWSWAFGDGGTSTSQSPAHTYTSAGTYTVALSVTTADGSDTETKVDFVTVSEPPAPPAADFSASPTSGPAPLAVQFGDLSSPGTAPITSWDWSFGDGATSTAQNPSHTYAAAGTYTVSLSVTTADGTDAATKADYVTACTPPTADFAAAPTEGLAPLTVQFTDLSLPGTGGIGSWSWSFGDGGTSAEQSPSHAYTTAGVYSVSLTVSDACGSRTETKAAYVTVQNPCDATAYSIADAFVEVRADMDGDGCAERARVHFDANAEAGCSRSVFAKVLLRPEGTTAWAFEFSSACFTIDGTSPADATWIQVQNLPQAFYEIRVELYECGGAVPVAARDHLDDPDLGHRCLE